MFGEEVVVIVTTTTTAVERVSVVDGKDKGIRGGAGRKEGFGRGGGKGNWLSVGQWWWWWWWRRVEECGVEECRSSHSFWTDWTAAVKGLTPIL